MEILDNEPKDTAGKEVLVFGGRAAKGLATYLAETWDVELLTEDETIAARARSEPYEAEVVEYDAETFDQYVDPAGVAIVATERDSVGLMITQLLNTTCKVDDVLVRVDDPKNREAFEDIDCELIETGEVLREAVEATIAPGEN